jgi:hypothetical protein
MDIFIFFYFFILLVFLKSINIDYRLVVFIFIFGIYYFYSNSIIKSDNVKLNNSPKEYQIYKYGNIVKDFDDLDEKNIREIKDIKEKIYNMNIQKNDKIEIYSSIKKYFHIFNNYNKYDYKHNWLNDLHEFENIVLNKISSLNISYENNEENIQEIFDEAENIFSEMKSKFNNNHVYNNINYPSGYDKNKYNSYLF